MKKIAFLLYLLALAKSIAFSFFGFGLLDQGESMHNGKRILEGALPYRDFYAIFPPIDNYFYAYILKYIGNNILFPRIFSSVIFAFSPVLVYLIIKKFVGSKYALYIGVLFVFIDLNVERLFFFTPLLLSSYVLLSYIKRRSDHKLWLAGGLMGITSLFRVDIVGAYFLSMCLVVFVSLTDWRNRLSELTKVILGFITPWVFVAIFLSTNDILSAAYHHILLEPLIITSLHGLPFPWMTELLSLESEPLSAIYRIYTVLVAQAILVVYVASAVLLKKGRVNKIYLWYFLAAGLLMLPYIFGRSDLGHLVKGGIPALFLLPVVVGHIERKKVWFGTVVKAVLAVVLVFNVALSIKWIEFNDSTVNAGGNVLRINSVSPKDSTAISAQSFEKISNFLEVNSDENDKVLIVPYFSGMYYLFDRDPPNRFNNLLNGFVRGEDMENEFIDDLESGNVHLVIYDEQRGPKMEKHRLKDYNPLIHNYIMENYIIVDKTIEGVYLMVYDKSIYTDTSN